jgi:hypothetical protein
MEEIGIENGRSPRESRLNNLRPLTLSVRLLMTDEMRMTVVTPIMMPSMVRPERGLFVG